MNDYTTLQIGVGGGRCIDCECMSTNPLHLLHLSVYIPQYVKHFHLLRDTTDIQNNQSGFS